MKVEKKEEGEQAPIGKKKKVLGTGKYVFRDGKYQYVKEEEVEEEEVEEEAPSQTTERVSSKYSYSYTTNEEKTKNEKEEREEETPGEEQPKYKFGGRYVYVGGRYVYVKDGQQPPSENDVYTESYIRKRAEVKFPHPPLFSLV